MAALSSTPRIASADSLSVERLERLFNPTSIALVGASEKSNWSHMLHHNLTAGGFSGKIYYVNPRGGTVHGRPAVASLRAIEAPVDLAYVMVPGDKVIGVFDDVVASGIRNAVVLSSGFAETGEEGAKQQAALLARAAENDVAIVGPNCLGFINFSSDAYAMTMTLDFPVVKGGLAVVSQSGALGGVLYDYLRKQNTALNLLITLGNEANVTIAEAIDYAVSHPDTQAIAVFIESVRHPERFVEAATRALQHGKPIIALKNGRSALSAHVALAHTGSLVGDDGAIDALFKQLGILRVESLEDLALVAATLGKLKGLDGKRVGMLSISGGGCGLAADRAEDLGLRFPAFAPETQERLRAALPALGPCNNPLDVTGAAITNERLFADLIRIAGEDPNFDVLLSTMSIPSADSPAAKFIARIVENIAQAQDVAKLPSFLVETMDMHVTPVGRDFLSRTRARLLTGGLDHVLSALSKAVWWQEQRRNFRERPAAVAAEWPPEDAHGTWSEWRARTFLQERGVPCVPATLAKDASEALEAAHRYGYPVALKIVSPDILHKSDVGGVALDLTDDGAVRLAFEQMTAKARELSARVDGVIVSPMRRGGIELIVGIVRTPPWGQTLAIGLGGVYVEIFKDTQRLVLPVHEHEVVRALESLKSFPLLTGARGKTPVDLAALTATILRIASIAERYGAALESLEINPLSVDGPRIEALDALVTWRQER